MDLNTQIIAYLTVNNITFTTGDYQTGQPAGETDQILVWNTVKLGEEPMQTQLNASYPIWEGQQIAAKNKADAVTLLSQTDWACTVDITDIQYSNPYLMNQTDFLTYRSLVRNIAVNPPTTLATFPTQPQAVWSN